MSDPHEQCQLVATTIAGSQNGFNNWHREVSRG